MVLYLYKYFDMMSLSILITWLLDNMDITGKSYMVHILKGND